MNQSIQTLWDMLGDIHPEYRCNPDESQGLSDTKGSPSGRGLAHDFYCDFNPCKCAPISSKGKTPTTNHGSTGSRLPFNSAVGAPYNPQSQCSPLCGASKAYGERVQPWHHEPQCPASSARLVPNSDLTQALYNNIVTLLEDADARFVDDRTRFLFIQDIYEETVNYGIEQYRQGFNEGRDDHIEDLNHSRSM